MIDTATQRKYVSALMIPVLLIVVYYLHGKEKKTNLEKAMLLGTMAGLLFHTMHTYHWYEESTNEPKNKLSCCDQTHVGANP